MWFSLFLWVVSGAYSCTLLNGTVVANNGDLTYRCVECQLRGALVNSTTCVYPTIPDYLSIPVVEELSTSCDRSPTLFCQQFGECVVCKFGVFADECNNNGFLEEDNVRLGFLKCTCYDYVQSVGRTCQKRTNNTETRLVTLYYNEEVECLPHRSVELGFFETPETCLASYLGPPPGQLGVETSFPRKTCNQFGEYTAEGFKVCHENGDWNTDTHSCDCYENFNAKVVAYSVLDGSPVYSCVSCYGPWYPPGACDLIFFQNDVTGDYLECSEHGTSSNGQCICDASPEKGYWKLTIVKQNYLRIRGNGTVSIDSDVEVRTCLSCRDDYEGLECKTARNKTASPTSQPTSSPTVDFWSYGELCEDVCYQQYQGAYAIASLDLAINTTRFLVTDANGTFRSTCFNDTVFTVLSSGLVSVENLNDTTTLFLHSLGIELCSYVECKLFSWLLSDTLDSVVFTFFNQTTGLVPVLNELAGTSFFCKLSSSPTRTPTAYPTFYPTFTVYPTLSPTTSPSKSPTTICSTCDNDELCVDGTACVGSGELQFVLFWEFSESRRRRLEVTSLSLEVFPPSVNYTFVTEDNRGPDVSTAWGNMDNVGNPTNVYWSSLETGHLPPEGYYNVCVTVDALALPVNYTVEMYVNNKQLFLSVDGNVSSSVQTVCREFLYLTPMKVYMTTEVATGAFWSQRETLCHEEFGTDSFFYGYGYNRSLVSEHSTRPVESANGTLLTKTFEQFKTGELLTSLFDAGLKTSNEVWMGLTENGHDFPSMSCESYSNSSYESISKTASTRTTLHNWEVLGSVSDDVCEAEPTQLESFRHCNITLPVLCLVIN